MKNLTVEQRIEKIKELAGEDIGVVLNMNLKSLQIAKDQKHLSLFMGIPLAETSISSY